MRFVTSVVFIVFILAVVGEENLAQSDDADLDAFKRAGKQKQSAEDIKALLLCCESIMDKDDVLTKDQEARKLGVCLARTAMRKEAEGTDNATDMVRRMNDLVKTSNTNSLSVSRRGWFRRTVKKVGGWIKKNKSTIQTGIAIGKAIIGAIWGK